jgi:hypothetical protein
MRFSSRRLTDGISVLIADRISKEMKAQLGTWKKKRWASCLEVGSGEKKKLPLREHPCFGKTPDD